jgi:hypothetical protein
MATRARHVCRTRRNFTSVKHLRVRCGATHQRRGEDREQRQCGFPELTAAAQEGDKEQTNPKTAPMTRTRFGNR